MMNPARPLVHQVEIPPSQTGGMAAGNPLPRGRMDDLSGMSGRRGGLTLRLNQFAFAFISLYVMASTDDMCIWDRPCRRISLCWWISMEAGSDAFSTLLFASASATAAITDQLISVKRIIHLLGDCGVFCNKVPASIAMAYLSWLVVSSSFILNYWNLVSKQNC
ncbi:hypothetical protein ACFX15_040370 [Malus domestica]